MKKYLRRACFGLLIGAGILFPGASALADTSITANITTNTTWTTAGNVYIIENSISINSGVTLTINSGVIVKFRSALVALTVNGTLDAQGTATSSIYFTSINDDIGGDTNGTTTPPASGNWKYIVVSSGGTATLKYAIVRYGGTTSFTNLYNNGGTITFNNSTSTNATKYGFYHVSGISNIATSTFSDNGNYGIYESAGSGTTTVQNSNFSNNPTAAGYFDLTGSFVLQNSGNTASGIGLRGLMVNGAMSKSQTWQADTIPYIVTAFGVSIPSGKTLTVNPNAVVKFETTGASLTVNGTLNANGASTSRIYFTSIKDDIGGDTNGDGASTTPAAGNWQRILINSGATTTLAYAFVGYGGATFNANVYNNGTTTIKGSEIATSTTYGIKQIAGGLKMTDFSNVHGQQYGIYATGGTLAVTSSDIHANTYGIYSSTNSTVIDVTQLHGNSYGFYVAGGVNNLIQSSDLYNNLEGVRVAGGSANIASNSIHGNTTYGVNNTTGVDVHAEYNYWGATNGPSGAGSGSGDAITVKVLWSPYLDQAHYILIGSAGKPNNSVDLFKDIDWGWSTTSPVTSTSTQSAWYYAVDTWNTRGQVTIATTSFAIQDLTVSSTTRSDVSWGAQWQGVSLAADTIEINAYTTNALTLNQKKNVTLHELGHALGLGHSYIGNVMYYTIDMLNPQTTLGTQDTSDYDYCWVGTNCSYIP